jgi:hypothetical protein
MSALTQLAPPSAGEPANDDAAAPAAQPPSSPSAGTPSGPLSLSARDRAGSPAPADADATVAGEEATTPSSSSDGAPSSLPPFTPPRRNRSLDRREHPTRVVLGAAGRFSILAGSGGDAVQPYGGGFGVFARFTPWHAGFARFGFGFDGGYTRWTERLSVAIDDGMGGETTIRRAKVLGHADLSAGPNVELVAGPVIVHLTTGVGVGIDTFLRPAGVPEDEVSVVAADFLWRSSAALVVPIYRDQGLAIGTAVGKYVTRSRVALPELAEPDGSIPEVAIFDLVVETSLAYVAWF